ncbi:MAG: hypothetical protein JSR58_03190 [Verrucomicrobia bacterium]|nr:hypothetical protein [Verrucomicrobiota bacterium]
MIVNFDDFLRTYPSGNHKADPEKRINELAIKIFFIAAELTLAAATFFILREQTILPFLTFQNPWVIKTICIATVLLTSQIFGYFVQTLMTYFAKKTMQEQDNEECAHKIVNLSFLAYDLSFSVALGACFRMLKIAVNESNPTYLFRGKSLPLETIVFLTLCVGMLIFQRKGPGWASTEIYCDRQTIKIIQDNVQQGLEKQKIRDKMNRLISENLYSFKAYITGQKPTDLATELKKKS